MIVVVHFVAVVVIVAVLALALNLAPCFHLPKALHCSRGTSSFKIFYLLPTTLTSGELCSADISFPSQLCTVGQPRSLFVHAASCQI